MVSDRELDFTLVNSNEFRLMRSYLPNLDVAFTLGEIQTVAWLCRAAQMTLRDRLRLFLPPRTGVLMAELSERFMVTSGSLTMSALVDSCVIAVCPATRKTSKQPRRNTVSTGACSPLWAIRKVTGIHARVHSQASEA